MALLLKEREVGFPHLVDRMRFEEGVSDELVWFTGCITADGPLRIAGPERLSARDTDLADESLRSEIIKLILFFHHLLLTAVYGVGEWDSGTDRSFLIFLSELTEGDTGVCPGRWITILMIKATQFHIRWTASYKAL